MTLLSQLKITCDSSGAGNYKSTKCREKIKTYVQNQDKAILVVASIPLQKEYQAHLIKDGVSYPDFAIINSEGNKEGQTVGKDFISRLLDTTVICITHEAFKMIDHKGISKDTLSKFRLIFDEAPVPYWSETISHIQSTDTTFSIVSPDLSPYFRKTNEENGFVEVDIRKTGLKSDLINYQLMTKIENRSFIKHLSTTNYNSLLENQADKINIFGCLDFSILELYKSVYVYSAAFHTTPMGILLKTHGATIKYDREFEKHDRPVIFHASTMNDDLIYHHTKCKNGKYPERLDKFRDYTKERIGEQKYILLRNKSDDSKLDDNCELIPHNCHGVNSHLDKCNFVFESALNPSSVLSAYMKNILKFSQEDIIFSMSGNTLYQSMMRLSIRNLTQEVEETNVFCMDAVSAVLISDTYFHNYEFNDILISSGEYCSVSSFVDTLKDGKYQSAPTYNLYINYADSLNLLPYSVCEYRSMMVASPFVTKKNMTQGMFYIITKYEEQQKEPVEPIRQAYTKMLTEEVNEPSLQPHIDKITSTGRFDITKIKKDDSRHYTSFDILYNAKKPEGALDYLSQPKYPDRSSHGWYDPKMSELKLHNAEEPFARNMASLKPDSEYKQTIQEKETPNVIYRGMSHEEFHDLKNTGQIHSKGEFNMGGQEGLTYYSTDPSSAQSYAHSFAPMQFKASGKHNVYVVGVKNPGTGVKIAGTGEHEVGIPHPIKISDIVSVHEGKAYSAQTGTESFTKSHYGLESGGGAQPSVFVGWKKLV